MAKAVLVMDMPETCCDCRFCREFHDGIEACCELADESSDDSLCLMIDDYCYHKPEWCPLRELPEYKRQFSDNGNTIEKNAGFNECLDKILGKE